jgi:hypothetical protein
MTLKTTLTPSEAANASQGLQFLDSLHVHDRTAPAATDILTAKVMREPGALLELVLRAANWGTASETILDVKKNGTTMLAAAVTVANTQTDGSTVIALPSTDALATLEVGDIVTIETGATVGTGVVDLTCEARIAKRFA